MLRDCENEYIKQQQLAIYLFIFNLLNNAS